MSEIIVSTLVSSLNAHTIRTLSIARTCFPLAATKNSLENLPPQDKQVGVQVHEIGHNFGLVSLSSGGNVSFLYRQFSCIRAKQTIHPLVHLLLCEKESLEWIKWRDV